MYDPELPDGIQDGDFEEAELYASADREARLKRHGICTHGHRQGFNGQDYMAPGQVQCLECKVIFQSEVDIEASRQEALL